MLGEVSCSKALQCIPLGFSPSPLKMPGSHSLVADSVCSSYQPEIPGFGIQRFCDCSSCDSYWVIQSVCRRCRCHHAPKPASLMINMERVKGSLLAPSIKAGLTGISLRPPSWFGRTLPVSTNSAKAISSMAFRGKRLGVTLRCTSRRGMTAVFSLQQWSSSQLSSRAASACSSDNASSP